MALFLWSEAYSVGVDSLDTDHIILASLINHLDDASHAECRETVALAILKALISYARAHFRREERLMEKHGYPDVTRHRDEHQILEGLLTELFVEYERIPDPETHREIMELLNHWVVDHILKVDMRYRDHMPGDAI
jgi:hemerythrin-like metal-binding protein